MAAKKKMGLIDRMMLGKEKSEGYARASLPSNRWELFWDILKGRFGKLVLVNFLTLLFFIPLVALIVFRYVVLLNYGTMYPFSQGFGVAFMMPPSMVGYSENIVFNVDIVVYLFLPLAAIIAAVGVSGGMYVIRNMVWTEGIFVSNDFWRGIKQNFRQVCTIALTFSLLFYFISLSIAMCEQSIALGVDNKWIFVVSEIFSYIVLVLYGMMCFHMLSMCVTYDMKMKQLFRNSFLFTIGLFPQSIFFLFLGALPFFFLTMGDFMMALGIVLILFIALSLLMLIWTDFSQWAFDKFINDKVPGAQKNKGIYEKIKESDSGALKKYREQMALTARSTLNSKPIKPITDDELKIAELPTSFRRDDIIKLNESKQAIIDDHKKYVEEHMNDPEFQPTEDELALENEKAEREKRIALAKKELAKRNRNK